MPAEHQQFVFEIAAMRLIIYHALTSGLGRDMGRDTQLSFDEISMISIR
jgi:hypothetical protein